MNKRLTLPTFILGVVASVLLCVTSCKKDEPEAVNPLLACRPASGGTGIGTPNARTVMFWIGQDFGCGTLTLVSMRNTETNGTAYGGLANATISRFFSVQPACGTTGCITIQVSKGYEYEYTISCTGRQWKNKVTVDCSSDDCIPIQLK